MEPKLDYNNVLISPRYSEISNRSEVNLLVSTLNQKNIEGFHSPIHERIPIIAANMTCIATMNMALEMHNARMLTALNKTITINDIKEFDQSMKGTIGDIRLFASSLFITLGISNSLTDDLNKINDISEFYMVPIAICIDTANGHMKRFIDRVYNIRKIFPKNIIMAGNVCTPDGCERLYDAGADIIKVGVGPGSACSTRLITGCGIPQFSAVLECCKAMKNKASICADGGFVHIGDIPKAFVAGAKFAMTGKLLAGHSECGGEEININGVLHRRYFGMASNRGSTTEKGCSIANHATEEGREYLLPDRGPVKNTLNQISAGLRSACSYTGAKDLYELETADWIQVFNTHNTSL